VSDEKMILSVQVPTAVDRFLTREAGRRLTSKSAVAREILADHIRSMGLDPACVADEPVATPTPEEVAA
jgi:hypothetical protein